MTSRQQDRVRRAPRHARSISAWAIAAALAALTGAPALAATATWVGLGTTPLWSDAANWLSLQAPLDGDDLLFGGAPALASSTLDVSRSFAALSFAADAGAFALHVQGDGATVMSFTGAGVRNLTAGSGPIRQTLWADAGSTGGTLQFSGNAGLNLGADTGFRPLDLMARGGTSAGQIGGRIVFAGQSSTSASTFDSLRAEGASASGAGSGSIQFRDDAVATARATITLRGGSGGGAAGGSASFSERASAAANLNVLAGDSGGLGGRLEFTGTAVAAGGVDTAGAATAGSGTEGRTAFRDDARLTGSAVNRAGGQPGAGGGETSFAGRASVDASSLLPGSGTLIVFNDGASQAGAGGGTTVLRDDASVRGSEVFIFNGSGEDAAPGSSGGSTRFLDRSRAGAATIRNAGAGTAGADGGATRFLDQSSAERAYITMDGGAGLGAAGGTVLFGDDATAASARLVNSGGTASGARGGTTYFGGRANAGAAILVNGAGTLAGASGGSTEFSASAGAGQAAISNEAVQVAGSGGRGSTLFKDASSAQAATIDNHGGLQSIDAFTTFSQTASAGTATITNFGGRGSGAGGGFTQFLDRATAGAATLVMAAGEASGAAGGSAVFFGDTNAGDATLQVRGAAVVGAAGGMLRFLDRATAGRSQIAVDGALADHVGGPEGGRVAFGFDASADAARFTISGNHHASSGFGQVSFDDNATAAQASFETQAGVDLGGRLAFAGNARAGSASITNGSPASGSGGSVVNYGGITLFSARSTADHAAITNQAGPTAFGAQTVFQNDSTAADAVIVNAGGRAGETGGITFIRDTASAGRSRIENRGGASNASGITLLDASASAGQAVLVARGATVAGDIGGRVIFAGRATAAQSTLIADGGGAGGSNVGQGGRIEFGGDPGDSTARVVLNGGSNAANGGTLAIGNVGVWLVLGSIEGAGQVELGSKSLILGSAGRSTSFSGQISGSTPAVFPALSVLGGSLTLSGANVYTGRTQVGDGLNPDSGKLVTANTSGSATGSGAVIIERGGTLGGSGFIAGPVTLHGGGTIAPGDPVTLTLRDSLTWDGGGVVRLVLGADDAGSDHLVVHELVRGAGGSFVFELVDAGIVAGQSYALIHFDTLTGFGGGDFTFAGSAWAGQFSVADGAIGFTAVAVPEAATAMQFALGALVLAACARRAGRAGRSWEV